MLLDNAIQHAFQYASALVALITLIRVIVTVRRDKRAWLHIMPIAFFVVHVIAFYAVVFWRNELAPDELAGIPTRIMTDWSVLLRFHSLVTFAFLSFDCGRNQNNT